MNGKEFLSYLSLLRLPEEVILQKGLGTHFAKQQIIDTTPIKRARPLMLQDAPVEIQSLYRSYDLSSIQMLWTRFLPEPRQVPEGWHFATMAETRIVRVPAGRIEAYLDPPIRARHGDSQFLGVLAESLDTYLHAMLCGAMLGTHFAPGYGSQPGVRKKLEPVVQLCILLAGGKAYEYHWAGTLGL